MPSDHSPAFPDACLVTARPMPGQRVPITTLCLRRWLQVAILKARPARIELPLTPKAARHLRFRAAFTAAVAIAALAFPFLAWLGRAQHLTTITPITALLIAVAGIVIIAVSEWLFPPAIDLFHRRDTLRIVFRERTLAYQTARLNEAEVRAKGK